MWRQCVYIELRRRDRSDVIVTAAGTLYLTRCVSLCIFFFFFFFFVQATSIIVLFMRGFSRKTRIHGSLYIMVFS